MVARGCSFEEIEEELGLDPRQITMCEESWQDVHSSYDHTPEDSRPREFTYEIDEVKSHIGVDILKKVGDLDDADIKNLLLHVEGELESEEDRARAEKILDSLRKEFR